MINPKSLEVCTRCNRSVLSSKVITVKVSSDNDPLLKEPENFRVCDDCFPQYLEDLKANFEVLRDGKV